MTTVFITGTAGFIGYHLARELLCHGVKVVGYDGLTDYYDVTLKKRRHQMLSAHPGFSAKIAMLEDEGDKKSVKKLIKSHKKELKKIFTEEKVPVFGSHIYHSIFHIPCLFNSGCVIGKRGMTCLEIDKDEISLVHWFDKKISKKYLDKRGYEPEQFADSDYYRMVLNKEYLNYIFSRINLLA